MKLNECLMMPFISEKAAYPIDIFLRKLHIL